MSEEVYTPKDEGRTLTDALKHVCKISRSHNSLKTGGREVTVALMNGIGKLVILAKDHHEKVVQIIQGLCKEKNVPIVEVETREMLGSIVGFEKVNGEGKVHVYRCGGAVIEDFCEESWAKKFIEEKLSSIDAE